MKLFFQNSNALRVHKWSSWSVNANLGLHRALNSNILVQILHWQRLFIECNFTDMQMIWQVDVIRMSTLVLPVPRRPQCAILLETVCLLQAPRNRAWGGKFCASSLLQDCTQKDGDIKSKQNKIPGETYFKINLSLIPQEAVDYLSQSQASYPCFSEAVFVGRSREL